MRHTISRRRRKAFQIVTVPSAPAFTAGPTTFTIAENSGANQVVGTYAASGYPAPGFNLIGPDAASFTIGGDGLLRLTPNPDFEAKASYDVTVQASNASGSVTRAVAGTITDVNENVAPVITSGPASNTLQENNQAGVTVATFTATGNPAPTWSLSGVDAASFAITQEGVLSFSVSADYETKSSYAVTVVVTNVAGSDSEAFLLTITDFNENVAPQFTSGPSSFTLAEESGANQVLGTYVATGVPTPELSLAGTDVTAFSLSPEGFLRLVANPDFETKASYDVTVVATNVAGVATVGVIGTITNIEELAIPVITSGPQVRNINENTGENQVIGTYTATGNPPPTWSITGTDAASFTISTGGVLTLLDNPNFEAKASYSISVVATNSQGADDQVVTVAIEDIAEGPFLQDLTLSVNEAPENAVVGSVLATVQGRLEGSTLTMTNTGGGKFSLGGTDNTNFVLATALDFETTTSHPWQITEVLGQQTKISSGIFNVTDVSEGGGGTPITIDDIWSGQTGLQADLFVAGAVWQDTAATLAADDAAETVARVDLQNGNAGNLLQSTAANEPVLTIVGGKKAISFTGAQALTFIPATDLTAGAYTLVLAGRTGTWIETGSTTLAAASTQTIGGTDGLAPGSAVRGITKVIGDLVGVLYINKVLTADEKNIVLYHYQTEGAGGELVESATEIMPTPVTDPVTANFTAQNATLSIVGGKLRAVSSNTGTGATGAYRAISGLTVGAIYIASGESNKLDANSANARISIFNTTPFAGGLVVSATNTSATGAVSGKGAFVGPADGAVSFACIMNTAQANLAAAAEFDNMSLRQWTPAALVGAPVTNPTYYVSPTGNNANDGLTLGAALLTIQAAANKAQPGDTVLVKAGTYAPFTAPRSGEAGKRITFKAYPGDERLAIIDGTGFSPRGLILAQGKSYLTFEGFTVQDAGTDGITIEGSWPTPCTDITIRNCKVQHTGNAGIYCAGIIMGNTPGVEEYRLLNLLIEDCEVIDTNYPTGGNECITVGGGLDGFIIRNNYIHDSEQYGIDAKLGAINGQIYGNEIARVEKHGIYLDSNSRSLKNIQVYDNEIYGCNNGITVARESTREPQVPVVDNIDIYDNFVHDNLQYGIMLYKHKEDEANNGTLNDVRIATNTITNNGSDPIRLIGFLSSFATNIVCDGNILSGNGFGNQINNLIGATVVGTNQGTGVLQGTNNTPIDTDFEGVLFPKISRPTVVYVPPGANQAHIQFTASRAINKTITQRFLSASAGTAGNVGGVLPAYDLFWRPGDDLSHWATLDLSAVTNKVHGAYFNIVVRPSGTGWDADGDVHLTIRIEFQTGAVNNLPGTLPNHRQPYSYAVSGEPAAALDVVNQEWSDTGYAGNASSGTGVLESKLPHGYEQVGNGEMGVYMNTHAFPTTHQNPHQRIVDSEGRPAIRLHSQRLPSPVTINGRTYNFQAVILTTRRIANFNARAGLWRVLYRCPSRRGAWSAFWNYAVHPDGNSKWPPEIDVVENFNQGEWPSAANGGGKYYSGATHYGNYGSNTRIDASGIQYDLTRLGFHSSHDFYTQIHEYAIYVADNGLLYYFVDGIEVNCMINFAVPQDALQPEPAWKYFWLFQNCVKVDAADGGTGSPYTDGNGDLDVYSFERFTGSQVSIAPFLASRPWANREVLPRPGTTTTPGGGGGNGAVPVIVNSTIMNPSVGVASPATINFGFTPSAGNLLVVFATTDKDMQSVSAVTAGWTPLGQQIIGAEVSGRAFWKIAVGNETSFQWSWTNTQGKAVTAAVIEIDGAHATSPIAETDYDDTYKDGPTGQVQGTAALQPMSVITANANSLAVAYFWNDSNASTADAIAAGFSGFTVVNSEGVMEVETNGSAPAVFIARKDIANVGTTVSTTFTYTGGVADGAAGWLFTVRPA